MTRSVSLYNGHWMVVKVQNCSGHDQVSIFVNKLATGSVDGCKVQNCSGHDQVKWPLDDGWPMLKHGSL